MLIDMSFRKLVRMATQSSPMCLVCGASTKASPAKNRTKIESAAKELVSTEDNLSSQVPGVANLTYADLGEGIGQENGLRNVFRASRTAPGEMYIGRESVADRIAQLMSIAPDDDCIIMEGNPGVGLLTQAILNKGAKKLRVFENRPIFAYKLQALQYRYGAERLEVVCPYNIWDYRRKSAKKSDKEALSRLNVIAPPDLLKAQNPIESPSLELRFEDLLNRGRSTTDWSNPMPALKFVGIVPERTESFFMRRILNNVAKRRGFANIGRPEFFLLINQRQQSILTAQPGSDANFLIFRWISIVMQSFFEITVLETVHRNALLPPISKKQKPDEKWSLVRMKARRNLPELLDWSVLSEYAFFVNQAMTARRKPLIAWLEGWIPGYGRKLLDLGKDVYVRAGDLSMEEYIDLFRRISATPEYETSNLKIAFLSSGQMELPEADEDDMEDILDKRL